MSRVPNADRAVIATDKLRDYLLNLDHRRGGSKARLLHAFGYRAEDWRRLEEDLRQQHLPEEADCTSDTDYGVRYEIVADIETPRGRSLRVRSIWQIDTGTDTPRLITIVPE